MTNMKKFAGILLALVMVLTMTATAFAQTVALDPADADNASITISNAAKGETYTIYKLFDATVNDDDSIAYTGTVPAALTDYFEADVAGNISAKPAAFSGENMSDGLKAALKTWAASATATNTEVSDGSALTFSSLPYGYYVVTTSQGEQAITVDSTFPNVTIVDKNSSTPSNLTKTADDTDYNIGDTITYTVTFKTANYNGAGESATQIQSYIIEDTLPEWLSDVTVTSIIIDADGDFTNTTDDQSDVTKQFDNKVITLDWTDANGTSLYKNGAVVKMTYTAVLNAEANIDGEGNTNEVTVSWDDDKNPQTPPDKLVKDETIYTYAIALIKVDDKGDALAGATFQFPFYVQSTPDTDGAYIYAGTIAGEGLVNTITTPVDGKIIVKGVEDGTYSITETEAPLGYNKLTAPVEVTAVKTGETTTNKTIYLDANGNVTNEETTTTVVFTNNNIAATVIAVVNQTGSELPSTGGIGTTIFYVSGAVLAIAAVVFLVTKKRMSGVEE